MTEFYLTMFLKLLISFLICGILLMCGLLFLWVWKNWYSIILYKKLGSCYNTLPMLEHFYRGIGSKETLMNFLIKMGDHAIASGGLSSYWVFDKLYVVIANTEDADLLLKQHLEKDIFYSYTRLFLGNSLLCAPVGIWRRRRKAMNLVFSHSNVLSFQSIFAKDSHRLVEKLRPMVGKGAFCVRDACNALAFDTTCETILDLDVNSQNNPNEPLRAAVNYMLDGLGNVLFTIPARIKFVRQRMWWCRVGQQHRQIMRHYVNEAFSHHQPKDLNEEDIGEEQDCGIKNTSLFSLSTHRNDRYRLDLSELHEETLLLLLAATDTTSISLSFTLLLLSWYPDIQERAYTELCDVFRDSDQLATVEDLSRLRYLDAVIKESLRLYPPVPVVTRTAVSDVTLPSGLKVEKGRNFFIHLWGTNRNPKYWGPDAEQFRPERFLEDALVPHAFLSFSSGSRCCPGGQFALMLMKTALSALLREYRLLPALDVARQPRLGTNGLMKADHFRIRLELRTN